MNRSGVTENGDWLVELSYVDGETLASLLQDGASRMSLALRLQALESLASALSYIHFVGWLHGDLSTQNILFDRIRGKGILIDYGHAQPIDSISETESPPSLSRICLARRESRQIRLESI